jgi:hypothetical protein
MRNRLMNTNILNRLFAKGWPTAALVGLGLLVCSPGSTARNESANGATTVPLATLVCVVSGEGEDLSEMNMDPVVIVQGGKFKPVYPDNNEAAQQLFAKKYFSEGQKYRLTFGGGQAGTATVKKSGMGCNALHATVAIETTAKIQGQVRALATNSESLGRKASTRRAPTAAERAAVMALVRQIYRAKGTSAQLQRLLKTTDLTASDLNGDGKFELIGSFVIETQAKARRDLFLIAEARGSGFAATLVSYQSYKLPPEGFDSAINFVDQMDLDSDGVGEVFAIQGGFDGYAYLIYKKQNGRWRNVFSATGDAC